MEERQMSETLQSDLESADPVGGSNDATMRVLVRRLSAEAHASVSTSRGSTPWWKRRRTMIPLGIVGALALTGAAVFVPLNLAVNGTQVDLDVEIPIVYTTDTGVDVSCRYGMYVGDPASRSAADERLAAFVKNHDWTGIGQRIYDAAMANPFVPGPDDDWEVDNQELRDNASFFNALGMIWEEIPAELQEDGQSSGGTSDCTGKLR